MTDYDNILVDVDGAVATITLNRPEKLNAMSRGLLSDLFAALRELRPGDAVRVIRLKAAGRAFCAGYDLTPREPGSAPAAHGDLAGVTEPYQRTGDAAAELGESRIALDRLGLRDRAEDWLWMWSYRKPIVAQVQGYCLAGGGEMVGACDIVFAATDAQFGHPAGRVLGVPPATCFWPFKIGMLKTKELLFTGDSIDGVEAERIGMVNRTYAPEELDRATMDFCKRVAHMPLDMLTIHKHTTNRWFELAGLRTAVYESSDFDAMAHEAPTIAEWQRIARESGLKAALAWRDKPFGDGWGAKEPPAQ